MKTVLFLSCISLLTACSNKDIYNAIQKRNETQCYELPAGQQWECLYDIKAKPYEEYSKDIE